MVSDQSVSVKVERRYSYARWRLLFRGVARSRDAKFALQKAVSSHPYLLDQYKDRWSVEQRRVAEILSLASSGEMPDLKV